MVRRDSRGSHNPQQSLRAESSVCDPIIVDQEENLLSRPRASSHCWWGSLGNKELARRKWKNKNDDWNMICTWFTVLWSVSTFLGGVSSFFGNISNIRDIRKCDWCCFWLFECTFLEQKVIPWIYFLSECLVVSHSPHHCSSHRRRAWER